MTNIKTYSVKIRTRLSYDGLDNICGQYCRAAYSIHLGGLDNSGKDVCKIMIVACVDTEDRDRLKAVFAMRGATLTKNDNSPPPEQAA